MVKVNYLNCKDIVKRAYPFLHSENQRVYIVLNIDENDSSLDIVDGKTPCNVRVPISKRLPGSVYNILLNNIESIIDQIVDEYRRTGSIESTEIDRYVHDIRDRAYEYEIEFNMEDGNI